MYFNSNKLLKQVWAEFRARSSFAPIIFKLIRLSIFGLLSAVQLGGYLWLNDDYDSKILKLC